MNAEQRANLKAKIKAAITETEAKIGDLKVLTQPIKPENSLGRISRMDAINNKSINDKALQLAKMKLSKLTVSLTKVDDPNFGDCSVCKNPIQEGRLMLMPESTYCVRCAARR